MERAMRRAGRVVAAAVCAVVVLAGAGCGDDDGDNPLTGAGSKAATTAGGQVTSPADAFKAKDGAECPLLDTDKVNELVGHGLEMKVTLAYAQGCEFTATTDSAITVSISEEEAAEYDRVKNLPQSKPVSGVGDEAYQTNHGVLLTLGSKHYSIEVFDLNSRVLQDADTASISLAVAKAFVAAA